MSRNRCTRGRSGTLRSVAVNGIEPLERRRLLSAGDLDPSFSDDGRATLDFGGGVTVAAHDVAVQSDGKTIVVGGSSNGNFAIARFNLNGTPDTTFGPNHTGMILTHLGAAKNLSSAHAVAIGPDGKIVVVGTSAPPVTFLGLGIARYNTDGTLDKTFDNDGTRTTDLGAVYVNPSDVAVLGSGKILVAGSSYPLSDPGNDDFVVARFNTNGSLDGSFGDSGRRFCGMGQFEFGQAMAIDYSGTAATNPRYGSIVVVGYQSPAANVIDRKIAVARLTPNGGFDKSFDGDGRLTLTMPGFDVSEADGVTIQSSGKLVIVGRAGPGSSSNQFALLRLKANGALDPTFGPNGGVGRFTTSLGNSDSRAFDVVQNIDQALIVAGKADNKFAFAKFSANGVPDTSFGSNGKLLTSWPEAAGAEHIAYGPGRRFVAAGGAKFHTARYFDSGANLVYAASLDPQASEAGPDQASFFVYRQERLPTPTRVYFSIGGSAIAPGGFPLRVKPDYTVAGMTVGSSIFALPTYVDIPANQTYAVVYLTPNDDTAPEFKETAVFNIQPASGYEVGNPSGVTLYIKDNDSTVLSDTADAYVRDGNYANNNYGHSSELQIKTDNVSTGYTRYTYLKFDLSSVSTITSAKLRLYGNLSDKTKTNIAASIYSSPSTSWSETGITWNNKPAVGTTALATVSIIDDIPRFYDFDVASYLQSEKAAGHNIVTLVLKSAGSPYATFASRESGPNQPQLLIG